MHTAALVAQFALTYSALTLPLVSRGFGGPVPTLLEQVGAELGGEFSLLQLAMVVGDAGGWDTLLIATLWTYTILCPLLRPLSQLVVLYSPVKLPRLHAISRYISCYHTLVITARCALRFPRAASLPTPLQLPALGPSVISHQPPATSQSATSHQPSTLNPQPSTLNPQPSTLNPQPSTLNPQP